MLRTFAMLLALLPALLTVAAPPASAQALAEPAPITLTGRGQQVVGPVTLEAGLSIFRMKHDGSRNFIIHLLDQMGAQVSTSLVNEIGSFDGATARGILQAGGYVLEVRADGAWSVAIEQPRPAWAPDTPATLSGRGMQTTAFFTLPPGLKVATMQHTGQRNFIVKLLDTAGNQAGLSLANEIGPFSGSRAVTATGIHLLSVQADGDWSITIQ